MNRIFEYTITPSDVPCTVERFKKERLFPADYHSSEKRQNTEFFKMGNGLMSVHLLYLVMC